VSRPTDGADAAATYRRRAPHRETRTALLGSGASGNRESISGSAIRLKFFHRRFDKPDISPTLPRF
jgi:hypothetical protein